MLVGRRFDEFAGRGLAVRQADAATDARPADKRTAADQHTCAPSANAGATANGNADALAAYTGPADVAADGHASAITGAHTAARCGNADTDT